VRLRELMPGDQAALARILAATGFFSPEEQAIALELIADGLTLGPQSHYRFLVAEERGQVLGYACWGPIPGTRFSADLYWLAVDPGAQRRGIGRKLLAAVERAAAASGRFRLYIETSTRPQYAPTRAFYLACGYQLASELADYYAPGDGKAIFCKVLPGARGT